GGGGAGARGGGGGRRGEPLRGGGLRAGGQGGVGARRAMLTGLAAALAAAIAAAPAASAGTRVHPAPVPPAELIRFGPAASTFHGATAGLTNGQIALIAAAAAIVPAVRGLALLAGPARAGGPGPRGPPRPAGPEGRAARLPAGRGRAEQGPRRAATPPILFPTATAPAGTPAPAGSRPPRPCAINSANTVAFHCPSAPSAP